jgi:succinate dehydrogenase/fumarate reductase cytochrome b subunit
LVLEQKSNQFPEVTMSRDNWWNTLQGIFNKKAEKNGKYRKANFAKYDEVEYPLRQSGDRLNSVLKLGIYPAFITASIAFFCAWLLFPDVSVRYLQWASVFHFLTLLIFLFLLWVPISLAVFNWHDAVEMAVETGSTVALVGSVIACFPHGLLLEFLKGDEPHRLMWPIYIVFLVGVVIMYLFWGYRNSLRTAFRDVRAGAEPQSRKHPDRWLWFDTLSLFMILFAVIVIELWFLAAMGNGQFALIPYKRFSRAAGFEAGRGNPFRAGKDDEARVPADSDLLQTALQKSLLVADTITARLSALSLPDTSVSPILRSDTLSVSGTFTVEASLDTLAKKQQARMAKLQLKHRMTKLSWLCCGILSGLVFFLWACLPNRLMRATLIPVTFHERDVKGMLFKGRHYLYHFVRAMLLKYPILLLGGLFVTIIFLITPAILTSADRLEIMDRLTEADELILVLGVFIAWFGPMALAAVMPDKTFGEYFNHRLADHIMMVQGHTVFIGYGSLGKRVVDREISELQAQPHGKKFKKMFFEVITPDLRLEQLCSRAVVIERDPKDMIYSGTTGLLGAYGVVGTCRRTYKSRDLRGNIIHPEKRILVPIVIGEAREPFISSRVNLERASLVISMVPEEESVQAVFERAVKANVNSIICVTRSDQISYLTYRSRHHPIVLVYPKHNQGITLGQRLWAAMLKVRAVRNPSRKGQWPRVLVIGNNKANHYMIETLWTNLPDDHKSRNKIVKDNFAFIVTTSEDPLEYPMLKDAKNLEVYDKRWPATFITGGRYPYPPYAVTPSEPINIRTRVVNAADIGALESCLEDHHPEILVINHEEVEKSLLMLSRCMRALERIKTRRPSDCHFPLLLLSTARGDEWEQLSLGDATRYYDALCRMHKEDLAKDVSYPGHAIYHHRQRELMGESISDSHADAEELIAGACSSFLEKKFIEINSCLPNRPGALADHVARLAGIEFEPNSKAGIDELWQRANPQSGGRSALLPSFQYLRNIMLDPQRRGFALTGFAILAPMVEKTVPSSREKKEAPLVVRVFANDGRNYIERERDEDDPSVLSNLQEIKDSPSPGVPQVIDRLTKRLPEAHNTVGEFHQTMLDPQPNGYTGEYACPGMNICRIAAFQDYVLASNQLRVQRLAVAPNDPACRDEKLLHARNYHCCTSLPKATKAEIPHPDSPFARIFCCCRGSHAPGMIAMVLNTLLFRSKCAFQLASGEPKDDWAINIDYFKDISCQNSHFTLNRLFGFFVKKPGQAPSEVFMPLHLLRILPIGGMNSAKQWYDYVRALHYFLNGLEPKNQYKFYWLDEKRKPHGDIDDVPQFDRKQRRSFPVVLVIKRLRSEQTPEADAKKWCDLCSTQPKEYDCRKLRVWV